MHCFFFNDTATTEIYTLSLHDALPISLLEKLADESGETCHLAVLDSGEAVYVAKMESRQSVRLVSRDRKSTRLNSSHANISYAVFCLKKKKNSTYPQHSTTVKC